ncbi:protein PHLOEM PROTEIN 2-LIKE A1-like [Apium graveolens]|uniref:Phloem protein 2-1 n=1 Tax=Apium graveolens Dulce Group TaxID=117781 RepID=Q8L5H3_APIGR|nr:phloem protein 2-1 [Apium graveolens Dulce Group]
MAQLNSSHEIINSCARDLEGLKQNIAQSCAAVLSAKELSIVWGSDSRYWTTATETAPNSNQSVDVSELIEVCWLQIDGKYSASKLNQGVKYGVYFIVKLKTNLRLNGKVTLKLTRPDGRTVVTRDDLDKRPKNTWVALKVGEFMTNARTCHRNVKFSMNGCDGTSWKSGLVVIGAVIVPVC